MTGTDGVASREKEKLNYIFVLHTPIDQKMVRKYLVNLGILLNDNFLGAKRTDFHLGNSII